MTKLTRETGKKREVKNTHNQMRDIRRSIKRLSSHAEESEKVIEAYLVREVRNLGGICLKFASSFETGYPDRLVLMPGGRAAWVELKSKGEKPRRIQWMRMAELARLGFEVHVADSKEKVDEILGGMSDGV